MRNRRVCVLAAMALLHPAVTQYRAALPGYRFEFPRDHFNHPDFQTEWWYYTGNLKTAEGRRFGFELTFFRQALQREMNSKNRWIAQDLFVAHLALSDLDGGEFYHTERTNRAGPGIAGVSAADAKIWNGNWNVAWKDGGQKLQAIDGRFTLDFRMRSEKEPVIHGENGVSQKAEGEGRASHYISLTRLITDGEITLRGKEFTVAGTSWMDHEFFTHQLESGQTGWDWLSLQLDDNTELMLFQIRRKDGTVDHFSAGTYVDTVGKTMHLTASDFVLRPGKTTWISKTTGAAYPIAWRVEVPRLGIVLEATTPLGSQELSGKTKLAPSYWEGAITLTGRRNAAQLRGVGYLEMTGYDRPVELAP